MATVQEIYNEIDRIDNAKSGIAGAIEEKGVEVPAGAKIEEYPGLVRQIQQGDTSDCVKFTPQTLTEEQKAQARENIGAVGGKMGVISQTQTWRGSNPNPRTYVMSNKVTGLIPQANIDLFEAAGATFNTTTGYFEINGLTDVSYNEMKVIYNLGAMPYDTERLYYYTSGFRTNLPTIRKVAKNFSWTARDSDMEVFALNGSSPLQSIGTDWTYFIYNCVRMKAVYGVLNATSITSGSSPFGLAYSLESIQITKLKINLSFANSSLLTLASVVYIVQNAANTSAITITLHATAYARCQADTTEYTYGGNTYTGIIALATAHNITIASA